MIKFRVHIKNLQQIADLPASYHYELASALYKKLPFIADHYYCISGLWLQKPFLFENERLYLESNANFEVAILKEDIDFQELVDALLGKEISISDNSHPNPFEVTKVERLALPFFKSTMRYRTISPIALRHDTGEKQETYMHPKNYVYKDILIDTLYRKHLKLGGVGLFADGELELLSDPKERLITVKSDTEHPLKIKGYLFDFELTVPIKLHYVGYFGGFGHFNTFGFGSTITI